MLYIEYRPEQPTARIRIVRRRKSVSTLSPFSAFAILSRSLSLLIVSIALAVFCLETSLF